MKLAPAIYIWLLFAFSKTAAVAQLVQGPWQGKPQSIPGRVQCELYDTGGEGIAYHDKDSINNGSGKLNPANGSYLNEFRMKEGVDISYTKQGGIDDNPYNLTAPTMGQLYVGWTAPGEWIRYTVEVEESGIYSVGLMYTSNKDGALDLLADSKAIGGTIRVPTTYRKEDTVAWRQWHHWNKVSEIAKVSLTRGKHILVLRSVSGDMNYDYLEFTKWR
jgi:hypothetical protein